MDRDERRHKEMKEKWRVENEEGPYVILAGIIILSPCWLIILGIIINRFK